MTKWKGDPHFISETEWYYEEPKGICLVSELWQNGKRIGSTMTTLTWARIESALKRRT